MICSKMSRMWIGTREGLWQLDGDRVLSVETFAGKTLTALAGSGARDWVILDGRTLWEGDGSRWTQRATVDDHAATCLALTRDGLWVGTEEAHLFRLAGDHLERIDSFETVDGRAAWYTPWGDPADVRSISVSLDGAVYVNVHVGGVVRSRDGGRTFTPTVDIDSDVHQVLAHPSRAETVLAAAAEGFGVSRDGGASWRFVTEGLHAHYLRAVAASDDTVLVSASTGPGGRHAALYRGHLDALELERCDDGLPQWFGDNVDTGCLAASGSLFVAGTEDGRVFRSLDGGRRWDVAAKGLPPITCITVR